MIIVCFVAIALLCTCCGNYPSEKTGIQKVSFIGLFNLVKMLPHMKNLGLIVSVLVSFSYCWLVGRRNPATVLT